MTPLLDVQNISKAFGAHVLFENISFSIAEGQHVGLIAKNGTGKSTLLSLLSGKESVDSGSIIFRRDIKVGFLEQQPKFDPEESVLDACFNHQGDPDRILKAKQILTQLHITDLTQPMGQLKRRTAEAHRARQRTHHRARPAHPRRAYKPPRPRDDRMA